jgi:hypothetical protein
VLAAVGTPSGTQPNPTGAVSEACTLWRSTYMIPVGKPTVRKTGVSFHASNAQYLG